MKICIPTLSDKGLSSQISEHFGSAPYFTIYELDSGAIEIISNKDEHHAHGTCHPMSNLQGRSIDAVVCGGMGARAVKGLNDSGTKAFRMNKGTVSDVISQFKNGAMEEITPDKACSQHRCSGH